MSMTMVESGHIAHARALLNEDFFLAWGDLTTDYADPWAINEVPPHSASVLAQSVITRSENVADTIIGYTGIIKIISIVDADSRLYIENTDYYLDSGDINWSIGTNEPAPDTTYTITFRYYTEEVTSLIHEVGRRKVTNKFFVVEDELEGDIVANDSRWRKVDYPTRHLYLLFSFDNQDATDTSIYQIGLYIGSKPNSNLPIGKLYFLPGEIEEDGTLYMVDNVEPFPRNIGKREIFEYVITY